MLFKEVSALLGKKHPMVQEMPGTLEILVQYLSNAILEEVQTLASSPSIAVYQDYNRETIHTLRNQLFLRDEDLKVMKNFLRSRLKDLQEAETEQPPLGVRLVTRHIELADELGALSKEAETEKYPPLLEILPSFNGKYAPLADGIFWLKRKEKELISEGYPVHMLKEMQPCWNTTELLRTREGEAKDFADEIEETTDLLILAMAYHENKADQKYAAATKDAVQFMRVVRGYILKMEMLLVEGEEAV